MHDHHEHLGGMMSHPYDQQPAQPWTPPPTNTPYGSGMPTYVPPPPPRMFANQQQRIVWTLVPVVSFTILAWLPFVVACRKGVVDIRVPAVYGGIVAFILLFGQMLPNPGNWIGGALIILMAVSATHTALLDSEVVKIGRK
ncbi:hypothetical protein [Streptomyces sp. NPDC001380]|uniref:hypothetical protein n=1 Tax=Streptomyces sp. NPDC001380 TaxID=3364566 RepID=UPI0036BE0188